MEFYGYRKCSTCRTAHRHLTSAGYEIDFNDFVQSPPDAETLKRWVAKRGEGVTPFLNARGTRFKELGLTPDGLSEQEWMMRLSADGKLLKRPVLELDDQVLVGYQSTAYDDVIRQVSSR